MHVRIQSNPHYPNQRDIYDGTEHIGAIIDHRGGKMPGRWGIAWASGRYDWYDSFAKASAGALRGQQPSNPGKDAK